MSWQQLETLRNLGKTQGFDALPKSPRDEQACNSEFLAVSKTSSAKRESCNAVYLPSEISRSDSLGKMGVSTLAATSSKDVPAKLGHEFGPPAPKT